MNHLIFDMAGEFEGERVNSVSLWKGTAFDTISRQSNPRGKTDLKAAARQAIKDGWASRLRGNARTRLHEELGKECSQRMFASTRLDTHLYRPKFGRRMSWLWAARRAFETVGTSHRLRRASLTNIRASAHTQGMVNGDLVHVWRKVKRNNTDARRVLVTLR